MGYGMGYDAGRGTHGLRIDGMGSEVDFGLVATRTTLVSRPICCWCYNRLDDGAHRL